MKFDLSRFHGDAFVETGTFHGAGVRSALACGFAQVHTIEVFEPLVRENEARFAGEIERGTVHLHLGDSADVLAPLVSGIEGSITYWLDAHIQTMNGAGVGREKCPLVTELAQIARCRAGRSDIVLIDDLRLIEDRRAGWAVDLGEMYRLLWEIDRSFVIFRIDGHVPGDVLACVPRARHAAAS